MKKKIVVLVFVVAALVLVFGQVGFAQDMKGKFGIGALVAYANYSGDDDDNGVLGVEYEVDFENTAWYGINLTYFVHKYFSFELSGNYAKTDVNLTVSGVSTDIGEVEQTPILLNGRLHFSTNSTINPYFSLGVGYFLNDYELSASASSSIPTGSVVDFEDSIGWFLGTGVEYFLNEHFALNLDFKYIFNNTDARLKFPNESWIEESVSLNLFTLGAGLKFYF
jgi:outer membrane protein